MQRVFALAAAALLALPLSGAAQVGWDSPLHLGPGLTDGLGIHLVNFDYPGDDGLGAMLTWRGNPVPGGLGVRVGLAEGFDGEVAGFGGVDFSGYLVQRSEEFPMDLTWGLGAGAGIGDFALLSFPATLVLGRAFDADGVQFVPFIGPRLSLDAYLGRDAPPPPAPEPDDVELEFVLDLGTDIVVSPNLAIRFAASVGDRPHEAISIGVVLPGVR